VRGTTSSWSEPAPTALDRLVDPLDQCVTDRTTLGRADGHPLGDGDLLGRLREEDAVPDLLGPVAADQTPRRELAQHRDLVVAPGLLPPGTAGVEAAAARRVGW
jgi:hypothetical protein